MTTNNPLVSIIMRTKNEERWINSSLNSVFNQKYKNFEVIIVDNLSEDSTLKRLNPYKIKLVKISKFLPGKALNIGIRKAKGEIIVCLSGHCIPVNESWLENLIKNLEDENVAGVYGRQQPLSYSKDSDKRDLINLFGLDKRVQVKDPFFHNANSAFRKKIWNKFKFDEKLTNIEDRAWAKKVLKNGYSIIYEPEASVYHWHGVHHDMNPQRAKNIVKILENIDLDKPKKTHNKKNKIIYAIIPVKGKTISFKNRPLLSHTIKILFKSKKINKIFVVTDNKFTADVAKKYGAIVPFLRPKQLSDSHISIADVIQYTLNNIKNEFEFPDMIGIFEEIYPFRTTSVVNKMIDRFLYSNYDTLIAAKKENRGILIDDDDKTEMLFDRFMPSLLKTKKSYITLLGFGCFVKSEIIQSGDIIGNKIGLYKIDGPYGYLTIKSKEDIPLLNLLNYKKNK